MKRRLTLRREALTPLAADDLRALVAAEGTLDGCIEIRDTICCPLSQNILVSCVTTLDPPRCATS